MTVKSGFPTCNRLFYRLNFVSMLMTTGFHLPASHFASVEVHFSMAAVTIFYILHCLDALQWLPHLPLFSPFSALQLSLPYTSQPLFQSLLHSPALSSTDIQASAVHVIISHLNIRSSFSSTTCQPQNQPVGQSRPLQTMTSPSQPVPLTSKSALHTQSYTSQQTNADICPESFNTMSSELFAIEPDAEKERKSEVIPIIVGLSASRHALLMSCALGLGQNTRHNVTY